MKEPSISKQLEEIYGDEKFNEANFQRLADEYTACFNFEVEKPVSWGEKGRLIDNAKLEN